MMSYLRLMRLRQWTKNGLCLAGVLFSGKFNEPEAVLAAVETFAFFCLTSSAVYVLNDVTDRERDRQHPRKRERPVASGAVSVPAALALGVLLLVAGLAGACSLGLPVLGCLLLYVANSVAYSAFLKHLVLFDVLSIALGFVLRLLAGVYALPDVLPTTWITLCTFFLAVFLGFGKRRAELAASEKNGVSSQRPVLDHYSVPYLDHLLNSSAIMAVMCYALFTSTSGKNPTLVVTVPIVFYAVMHYKRLLMLMESGEEPEMILLKDRAIQVSVLVWLASYFAIIYGGWKLFEGKTAVP